MSVLYSYSVVRHIFRVLPGVADEQQKTDSEDENWIVNNMYFVYTAVYPLFTVLRSQKKNLWNIIFPFNMNTLMFCYWRYLYS
jgi:hypothetical protein